MVFRIAASEFRYLLRSPMMIVGFAIFFLLPFFAMISDNVVIGGGGNVLVNSPYAIMQTLMIMSIFTLFLAPGFIGNAVLRDFDHKMDGILFSTPIRKLDYLGGRFLGSFAGLLLCLTSIPLGMLVGSFWPSIDPQTLAPTRIAPYVSVFLLHVAPTTLFYSGFFFALAVLTRSVMGTYIGSIAFLLFNFIANQILNGPEFRTLTALLDPVGLNAMVIETQYWAAFERNEQVLGWTGLMLQNRLIWLGVSALLLALAYGRFSFRKPARIRQKKGQTDQAPQPAASASLPRSTPAFGRATEMAMLIKRIRFEVAAVVKSRVFLILMAFTLILAFSAMSGQTLLYGVSPYPVTRLMVEAILSGFITALFVIVIFYGADIVWRERQAGIHEIIDATPVPNWVFVTAKLIALATIIIAVMIGGTLLGHLYQLFSGFQDIESGLYAHRAVFRPGIGFLMTAVLSVTVQVLAKNRFLGMMIMVVFLIAQISLNNLGFEHPLYQFAQGVPTPMSDMNGSGRFVIGDNWLLLYWASFSVLLVTLVYLLWNRGSLQSLRYRLPQLARVRRPAYALPALLAAVLWLGSGGFVYYNTNILNPYITGDGIEDRQVAYEKKYRRYEDLAQPKLTAVDISVDLYPDQRRVEVSAEQRLENRSGAPIAQLHLVFPESFQLDDYSVEGASVESRDEDYHYHILTFDPPMAAGDVRRLTYRGRILECGFKHARENVTLVRNGTFINARQIAPHVGFDRSRMLGDRNTRRRKGLEPLPRAPKLEDETYWNTNYISDDADFIDFKTTVSTVADQIAIAPGYLQREWQEDGRRYFRYEMDAPILNFYAYLSADYEVAREQHGGVDIEVYHHAPHTYNVKRMIDAVKASLDTFSEVFSPYQHRQLRIIEFPAYRTFAQAFPNTVPFSEGIGFILDVGDDDIDVPFYVTAHEVAHQWWAHQVMSSVNQGGTMLVETFAQYGALLVMEREYGPDGVRPFLKRELDAYLRSRAGDPEGETPLYRVENQTYIHYRKGAVVMYALKDYLGEDVVNQALSKLIDLRGFQGTPYARSVDFIRLLKAEARPADHSFIDDQLEKITFYDMRVVDASMEQRADGQWQVSLNVAAEKYYADAEGRQTPAIFDVPVDIGVFARNPESSRFSEDDVIVLEKYDLALADGSATVTLTVDQEPSHVGIDPYNKLIDRDSNDNIKAVGSGPLAALN